MLLPKKVRRPGERSAFWLALGAPLAATAGWMSYSALAVPHNMPLPPALNGARRESNGRAGRMNYYVAGEGQPLLLLHSINAAASPYEVRPVFEHYQGRRRVYAPDLPGFGFSDRSARPYSPRLYTDAIFDMLDVIEQETSVTAVDALALSLSAEFLARAASEQPGRFRSLALVTPTAFGKDDHWYGTAGSTRGSQTVRTILDFGLWSRALFDLLTSKPSLRYFLGQTFGSQDAIDQELLAYSYPSSHQQDAQHAPFAFVAGVLFSADISRVYESLELPVWLAYGTRGQFSDFGGMDSITAKPNWTTQAFPTGALPYYEQPATFFDAYDQFLADVNKII